MPKAHGCSGRSESKMVNVESMSTNLSLAHWHNQERDCAKEKEQ